MKLEIRNLRGPREPFAVLGMDVRFDDGTEVRCYVTNAPVSLRAPGKRLRASVGGWTLTTEEPSSGSSSPSAHLLVDDAEAFLSVVRSILEDESAHLLLDPAAALIRGARVDPTARAR